MSSTAKSPSSSPWRHHQQQSSSAAAQDGDATTIAWTNPNKIPQSRKSRRVKVWLKKSITNLASPAAVDFDNELNENSQTNHHHQHHKTTPTKMGFGRPSDPASQPVQMREGGPASTASLTSTTSASAMMASTTATSRKTTKTIDQAMFSLYTYVGPKHKTLQQPDHYSLPSSSPKSKSKLPTTTTTSSYLPDLDYDWMLDGNRPDWQEDTKISQEYNHYLQKGWDMESFLDSFLKQREEEIQRELQDEEEAFAFQANFEDCGQDTATNDKATNIADDSGKLAVEQSRDKAVELTPTDSVPEEVSPHMDEQVENETTHPYEDDGDDDFEDDFGDFQAAEPPTVSKSFDEDKDNANNNSTLETPEPTAAERTADNDVDVLQGPPREEEQPAASTAIPSTLPLVDNVAPSGEGDKTATTTGVIEGESTKKQEEPVVEVCNEGQLPTTTPPSPMPAMDNRIPTAPGGNDNITNSSTDVLQEEEETKSQEQIIVEEAVQILRSVRSEDFHDAFIESNSSTCSSDERKKVLIETYDLAAQLSFLDQDDDSENNDNPVEGPA